MELSGVEGDPELSGNQLVGGPLGQQPQDLKFSGRENGILRGGKGYVRGIISRAHRPWGIARQDGKAMGDSIDGEQQIREGAIEGHHPADSGLQERKRIRRVFKNDNRCPVTNNQVIRDHHIRLSGVQSNPARLARQHGLDVGEQVWIIDLKCDAPQCFTLEV